MTNKFKDRNFGDEDQEHVRKSIRNILANSMCGIDLTEQYYRSSREGQNFICSYWNDIKKMISKHNAFVSELLKPEKKPQPKPEPKVAPPTMWNSFVSFLYFTFFCYWNN